MTWLLCVLVPRPGRASRSRTHTLRPRFAMASADARPTTPPPITAASICSIGPFCAVVQKVKYDHAMPSQLRDPSVPVTGSNPVTRVMITGAHGQLGAAIVRTFAGFDLTAHTRQTLDVTNAHAVSRAVNEAAPHLIVNCAAFNDVDG